jgi:predicted NAD-dependent protein-ADP-ribosyltransferase YbiA (DUF1768 family)
LNKIGARALFYYRRNSIENYDPMLEILEAILYAKLTTHPILINYLIDTNDSELVFIVSKFDTEDQKRLGFCEEDNSGDNGLGKLWMKIREAVKKKPCLAA